MIAMEHATSLSEDPQLLRVLEELRAAREAGKPLSRASFLARHPELATNLGPLFDTLEQIRRPGEDLTLVTIGNYQVLCEITRGGMGVIYQALQLDVGRLVALKVLATVLPRGAERFRQEASIAAQLHHTNIVPVFGLVQAKGHCAYAMPFIEGPSLAEVLADLRGGVANHPVSQVLLDLYRRQRGAYLRLVAELGLQAVHALDHAHRQGIVHRDVKPGNLLVDQGKDGQLHVWLHDFGLAYVEGTDDFARPGESFGTAGYQPPEQASGDLAAIDARSDLYSLGVTLFELLTLHKPGEVKLAVPTDLRSIVVKCLRADLRERYESGHALGEDLRCFLHDYPIKARRPHWRVRLIKWGKRHRVPLAAAVAAFMVTALFGTGLLIRAYWSERRARHIAEHNEELAIKGVTTFAPLVDDVLNATPGTRKQHLRFAATAYEVHEDLLAARPDDRLRQDRLASASWRLARAYNYLSRFAEAEPPCRRSIELYEALIAAEQNEPLHYLDLMRSLDSLRWTVNGLERREEVGAISDRLLDLARAAVARCSDDRRCRDALATYLSVRAHIHLENNEPLRSELLFAEALGLAKELLDDRYHSRNPLLRALNGLALAYDKKFEYDKAVLVGKEGLDTLYYLIDQANRAEGPDQKPDSRHYNFSRAYDEPAQAIRLARVGRWAEANKVLDTSKQARSALASDPELESEWERLLALADRTIEQLRDSEGKR
jgi:serine/threonine protein kinase